MADKHVHDEDGQRRIVNSNWDVGVYCSCGDQVRIETNPNPNGGYDPWEGGRLE